MDTPLKVESPLHRAFEDTLGGKTGSSWHPRRRDPQNQEFSCC